MVGLVQHGDLDVVEPNGAAVDQVESRPGVATSTSTPRRSAAICLLIGRPPTTAAHAQPERAADRGEGVGNLLRQLAGRDEHEAARASDGAALAAPAGGSASAGRRQASCRSRSGPGRGRRGRRARREGCGPGSGTALDAAARASAVDDLLRQAVLGERGSGRVGPQLGRGERVLQLADRGVVDRRGRRGGLGGPTVRAAPAIRGSRVSGRAY